jgi:alanine racemase
MLAKFRKLLGREYLPLNKIQISKKDLIANYNYLANLNKNTQIAPVVKSNAYGHGVREVAPILDNLKPPFLCVDSLYEAYELKKLNVKSPILIMGYIAPGNLKIKKLPFSYSIYDYHQAELLNKHQKGAKIHIKIDTGMHRMGIRFEELNTLFAKIKKLKNIEIEGIMSHFSSPKTFPDYTDFQIKNFKTALKVVRDNGITAKYVHIGASGGLLNAGSKITKFTNMARVGISLYGLYRTKNTNNIKPVLSLKSQIVQLKKIKKGEYVGYDKAFRADKDMVIACLPIGYNDGLDRRLTNTGFVKVKGKFAKIIGKVSMNITSIDVTGINAKVGDIVEVFSDRVEDLNSVENAANLCETIPHDLMVHLHANALKREIS